MDDIICITCIIISIIVLTVIIYEKKNYFMAGRDQRHMSLLSDYTSKNIM